MRKTLLITVLCLIMIAFSGVALGTDFMELPDKTDVPRDKVWTIEFSKSIDPTTICGDHIWITVFDSDEPMDYHYIFDYIVIAHPTKTNCVLVQPPNDGWERGRRHHLNVNQGVESTEGDKMPYHYYMNFYVSDSWF